MMTFVNMNSPGLLILPTHRAGSQLAVIFGRRLFAIPPAPSSTLTRSTQLSTRPAPPRCCASPDAAEPSILAVTANRAFFLHHPNPNSPQVFAGLSLRQQSLDVVQLHKCLLENVLNLSEESIRNQQNISYLRDAGEALSQVRSAGGNRANIAFLMNPCRMAQVRDVAFAGEVMPQKSTDFYPKLLSGLTIYALD